MEYISDIRSGGEKCQHTKKGKKKCSHMILWNSSKFLSINRPLGGGLGRRKRMTHFESLDFFLKKRSENEREKGSVAKFHVRCTFCFWEKQRRLKRGAFADHHRTRKSISNADNKGGLFPRPTAAAGRRREREFSPNCSFSLSISP